MCMQIINEYFAKSGKKVRDFLSFARKESLKSGYKQIISKILPKLTVD